MNLRAYSVALRERVSRNRPESPPIAGLADSDSNRSIVSDR